MINKYLRCIRLNCYVLSLFIKSKWLRKYDYKVSYNKIAGDYDNSWLCNITSITDKLIDSLPVKNFRHILDLGCGTGYTTLKLKNKYISSHIVAVDISGEMLRMAQNKCGNSIKYIEMDMLNFLLNYFQKVDLVLSAWAIGYSNPQLIIDNSSRVLKKNGVFAFVVNYMDTLGPISLAFRRTLAEFPHKIIKLARPKFPKKWSNIKKALINSGFNIVFHEDENKIIRDELGCNEKILPWILKTGIMAGFEYMLPLEEKKISDFFEKQIHKCWSPLKHNYVMVIAQKL